MQKNIDAEKKALDKSIDDWNNYKDKWSDILDEYKNGQDDLIAKQILGQTTEEATLNKRLDVLQNFHDKYIELQEEIKNYNKTGKTSGSNSSSSGKFVTKITSDYYDGINHYASGIDKVLYKQKANVDEIVPELIVHAPSKGRLTSLEYGDTVYNGDATKNIMDKLSASTNPQSIMASQLSSLQSNLSFVTPNNNSNSGTNVNQYHIDKVEFPSVTNSEEIKSAFIGLPDYFIQKSTSNI